MANSAYQFLTKVRNMRKKCLDKNIGNTADNVKYKFSELNNYVQSTANYSEEAIKVWIRKHYNDLILLIPSNAQAKNLINQLNQFCI